MRITTDQLAALARSRAWLLLITHAEKRHKLPNSFFFFFLRLATHGEPFKYAHTGIVVDADGDTFKTIEGNTNDDRSYEGYEVCTRVRGYAGIDFVVIQTPPLRRERQGSGDCGTAARPPRLPLRE